MLWNSGWCYVINDIQCFRLKLKSNPLLGLRYSMQLHTLLEYREQDSLFFRTHSLGVKEALGLRTFASFFQHIWKKDTRAWNRTPRHKWGCGKEPHDLSDKSKNATRILCQEKRQISAVVSCSNPHDKKWLVRRHWVAGEFQLCQQSDQASLWRIHWRSRNNAIVSPHAVNIGHLQ